MFFNTLPTPSSITLPPIVGFFNPMAGSGTTKEFAWNIYETLSEYSSGRVVIRATKRDHVARHQQVLSAIRAHAGDEAPLLLAIGGDGTLADVANAAVEAQAEGLSTTVVPVPAGTANDIARELGVPSNPFRLLNFLQTAQPVPLHPVDAFINESKTAEVVWHSLGLGGSGELFQRVESVRRQAGRASVGMYLQVLPAAIWNAPTFWASVNGSEPMPTGEALLLNNSTGIGGVGRVPLAMEEAQLHLLPIDPRLPGPLKALPSMPAFGEAFLRGALHMAGISQPIGPGRRLRTLPVERRPVITAGDTLNLSFTDTAGKPAALAAVLNGNPMETRVHHVRIHGRTISIPALASRTAPIFSRNPILRDRVHTGTSNTIDPLWERD